MTAFVLTVFLGAFLSFSVQPLVARSILPWYGGSPAVWSACLMFFQVVLLLGYGYAHLLSRRLPRRWQVLLHLTLLGAAVLLLPINPAEPPASAAAHDPLWGILLLLATRVGLPILLIFATAPLLQSWYHHARPGGSPYRLYSVSNLGSLLGLLAYPFLVEPNLGLRAQGLGWSGGFLLFLMACGGSGLSFLRGKERPGDAPKTPASAGASAGAGDGSLWILLAACGSILLLAVTHQLCEDIAAVPFLWVIPLVLYLLSYILCFDGARWYQRRVWVPAAAVFVAGIIDLLVGGGPLVELGLPAQVLFYCGALFCCCMICHGEMVRIKPPPAQLTSFYLAIALGAALGSAFVNLAAPALFSGYWELQLGLLGTAILLAICTFRSSWRPDLSGARKGAAATVSLAAVFLMALFFGRYLLQWQTSTLTRVRNFHGVLRVFQENSGEESEAHDLYHGTIRHGLQFTQGARRFLPTSYYGETSGAGLALQYHPRRKAAGETEPLASVGNLRVGCIGLGTGTICAYARPGDLFRFYEINPEVNELAHRYFTYLADAADRARIEVEIGDGRILLERDLAEHGSLELDVLILDAFSGDAIPIHLLTREAFALYWRHLKPDGILAVHISNKYLELSPVVLSAANEMGKEAFYCFQEDNPEKGLMLSRWILLTSNTSFLDTPEVKRHRSLLVTSRPRLVPWTDDYSNLISVLKIRD